MDLSPSHLAQLEESELPERAMVPEAEDGALDAAAPEAAAWKADNKEVFDLSFSFPSLISMQRSPEVKMSFKEFHAFEVKSHLFYYWLCACHHECCQSCQYHHLQCHFHQEC